jgi:transposase-like protein
VTVYRWVQRFTPTRRGCPPCHHAIGDRWQVDETYQKVAGQWRDVYCAIDQFAQVVGGFVSTRRDADAAERFFKQAIGATRVRPVEAQPIGPGCTRRRGGGGGAAASGMAVGCRYSGLRL